MNNINTLSHEDLKRLHKEGKISVRANMSIAMHICDGDPRIEMSVKVAHHFFKWAGILMFIGAPISMFFIKWYWGILILVASFMVFKGSRQSAGQFVVDAVLEHESLYYDCLSVGALWITEK